jgi:hypothetical protein
VFLPGHRHKQHREAAGPLEIRIANSAITQRRSWGCRGERPGRWGMPQLARGFGSRGVRSAGAICCRRYGSNRIVYDNFSAMPEGEV